MARELVAFCDGELTPYRARLFRAHLGICEVCRRDVGDVMQLIAQLSDRIASAAADAPSRRDR